MQGLELVELARRHNLLIGVGVHALFSGHYFSVSQERNLTDRASNYMH
jgi:hypothetical protein